MSRTDLLEIIMLILLLSFVYHFLKKKWNKAKEKKLSKNTRNLLIEMKARDTAQLSMMPQIPTAPSFLPYPGQSMQMVPVHKASSHTTQGMGSRGNITTLSQVYEPP